MKILHVVPYFAPAWSYGGTPRAVYEIATRQKKQGHQVDVLTTDAYSADERMKFEKKFEELNVYRLKNLSNWLSWTFHFVTPIKSNKAVFAKKYDIVHLHEARTLINLLALTSIQTNKFFFTPWGTLSINNRFSFIKKIMDFFVINQMRKKVVMSLAQNVHEKEILENYGFSSNKIVPLGIDFNFFQTKITKTKARQKLNLNQKSYLFCYLGRFSSVKGIDVLLEAFRLLQKNSTNLQLLLVGRDDGYEKQIKNYIEKYKLQKNVIISPPLYETDRILAYKASDCFISTPTVYEETSTTCLEALACSTPVITNKFAEIPLLINEDFLIQIQSNKPRLVALNMYAMMLKNSKVNIKKIKELFDWDNIVNNILNLYEKK